MASFWSRHRTAILHWGEELAVVVIGVLIALSAQQWADDRASRARAIDAERRIHTEVVRNAGFFVERLAIGGCLDAQIAALARAVVDGKPGPQPAVSGELKRTVFPTIYQVPSRSTTDDVYKSALGDGELASVAAERRAALALFYKSSGRLDAMNHEENELADRLQPLQLIDDWSTAERHALLGVLMRLDSLNASARRLGEQSLKRLRQDGFRLSAQEIAAFKTKTLPEWTAYGRGRYGPCYDPAAIAQLDPAILR